jgi:hypothetical protein
MIKYLRIAVTALCLTACVLLVALWVRSYWRSDWIEGQGIRKWHYVEIGSQSGFLGGAYCTFLFRYDGNYRWRITSEPVKAVSVGTVSWYGKYSHESDRDCTIAIFPYWSLLLAVVGLSILPWLELMK